MTRIGLGLMFTPKKMRVKRKEFRFLIRVSLGDVTEGRWEKDAWNAMAIEAVQLGYYDVDGHVAINRIKNILRKKVSFSLLF